MLEHPFDVAALERSLNDSATRVSTIWVSFLVFSLYLLTAATTVTHRQLFLAEPVKLPVLNIDLPLWGFFFLAPILFVILHAYVLMQVLLLARTAAAYNAAVERAALPPEENASLRQRLANTLFAQIFAGSPREREGWLGRLLKAMAWITLAIAPILILLVVSVHVPALPQPYRHLDASFVDRGGTGGGVRALAACAGCPAGFRMAKDMDAGQADGSLTAASVRTEGREA